MFVCCLLLSATSCLVIVWIVAIVVSNIVFVVIILSYERYLSIFIKAYYHSFNYSFNTDVASSLSLTVGISSSMLVANCHASTTHTA